MPHRPRRPAERHPVAVPASPACGFVPPYVLEALAASGDPALAATARATLGVDSLMRRGRQSAELRPGTRTTRPRLTPGGTDAPRRSIHDARNGTSLPGTLVRSEGDPDTGDREVGEAYDGLGATWSLWREGYGRNSLDGKGLPLVATVHYGQRYDNAFWDGTQMVFGDGDGTVFLPFTRSLDVIGHELAHGVTQYTSGLNYQGQSGALNESVSDVFGVLVVQRLRGQSAGEADWLVGADLLGPDVRGVALRSMAAPGTAYDDPRLGRDPQPGHWRDYVDTTDDNGGVHINSGIPNRAFHVAATTLGGNAWEAAGQVWFDTITGEISADCDFATFARLTVQAAARRFGEGSREADAVRAGWDAVGVPFDGSQPTLPGPPAPGEATPGPGPVPDPAPDERTEVNVRRTGGVAGTVRERTVLLGELPRPDVRAWQTLLGDRTLQALAAAPPRRVPDAFSYGVRCTTPPVDVTLSEQVLSDDVRGLLERTLTPGGSPDPGRPPA